MVWIRVALVGMLIGATAGEARGQTREPAEASNPRSRIIAGTRVDGDVDPRTLLTALEALPRRPERIVMVDTNTLPSGHDAQLRNLDAFVPFGSRVIYLRRKSQTLKAAEYEGGAFVLMLAVVIWHEMAHTEGLDERAAREREEALWKDFVVRGLVDSGTGMAYLDELRRRKAPR